MSNSYTAVPAIIPGPLTVNGLLTVNSDAGIRIGAVAPFVRVFKFSVADGLFSSNLQPDRATRDTTLQAAFAYGINNFGNGLYGVQLNIPGTQIFTEQDTTIAQDGVNVSHTGDTVETTLKTKTIPGGTLGGDGALIIECVFIGAVQGGVQSAFRIKIGAQTIASMGSAVTGPVLMRGMLLANNSTASVTVSAMGGTLNAVTLWSAGSVALDTTIDQNLIVTFQGGAATDNWTLQGWRVHAVVGRTAVL